MGPLTHTTGAFVPAYTREERKRWFYLDFNCEKIDLESNAKKVRKIRTLRNIRRNERKSRAKKLSFAFNEKGSDDDNNSEIVADVDYID